MKKETRESSRIWAGFTNLELFLKIRWNLMKDIMSCSISFIQEICWKSCAAFEKNQTNWRIASSNTSAVEADGKSELKCCLCYNIPALSFSLHKRQESFHFRIFSLLNLHGSIFFEKHFFNQRLRSVKYCEQTDLKLSTKKFKVVEMWAAWFWCMDEMASKKSFEIIFVS